ncbi:MAG TPA: Crp/Fnr family transcriptional regulator [Chitinispirillaceae bacterium]|nr:Crp/Fnr family transcriptional regulator [Chitinispirillaceae bacterium]
MADLQNLETILARVPLFANLAVDELKAISSIMVTRKYKQEQIIVREDDEAHTFFIIVSGTVHVAALTSEGKQSILATLHKGEFFGEMAVLDGERRSASVIAADECTLIMLYRKSFMEILSQYPRIAIQMLVEMSKRLRRSNRHINSLSLMSVYGRVAEVILQLARDGGRKVGNMVIIENRPTQQSLAEMAGTSRETVSRVLSQLQKKRYIAFDRKKMVILDEEKLYY